MPKTNNKQKKTPKDSPIKKVTTHIISFQNPVAKYDKSLLEKYHKLTTAQLSSRITTQITNETKANEVIERNKIKKAILRRI